MANVKVSMSKKGVLIGLIVLVLVLGGGGGYLLWRVNQKDTVAPTDSDASGDGDIDGCGYKLSENGCSGEYNYDCGRYCFEGDCGARVCLEWEWYYYAGPGGTVNGTDKVKAYAFYTLDSTPVVTATPNTGYKFTGWSDGKTDNPRQEKNVRSRPPNAGYTANFEALPVETVTLRYIAEPTIGGEIRGKAEQTVEKGKDGEQVVATPKSGYEFVKWEDNGSTEAKRQDTNVQGDITGKAIFQKAEAPVTCGDGICSEGENPLNCPADCPSVCGDGICSSGENSQNCPVDCGSGKVPDTAIFDDTKDTIIFGMAILLVGMAWTWISTLPKKAYNKISGDITEAKLTREKNTRESRRNRLERRIK